MYSGFLVMLVLYTIGVERGLVPFLYALASMTICVFVLCRVRPLYRIPPLAAAAVLLLICSVLIPPKAAECIMFQHAANRTLILTGTVMRDPTYIDTGLLCCAVEVTSYEDTALHIRTSGNFGRMRVIGSTSALVAWGDILSFRVSGVSDQGSGPVVYADRMDRTDGAGFFHIRRNVIIHLHRALDLLPYEQSSLGSMLVLGESSDPHMLLIKQFQEAGCRHLLALSGMHVYVIALIISLLLSRFLASAAARIIAAAGVIAFIILAGFQPSLVRAGVMYSISTLLFCIFRRRQSGYSVLAGSFMIQLLLFLPTASSVGFQLSYAAMFGILIGADELSGHFPRWCPSYIKSSVSASISAVVMTFPVLAQNFGEWFPVGIIATVALAPGIMAYMILTLLYLLCSAVSESVTLCAPLFQILYTYLESTSSLFCQASSCRIPAVLCIPFQWGMLALMTVRLACRLSRIIYNRKRKQSYEYRISLRFTQRNTTTT